MRNYNSILSDISRQWADNPQKFTLAKLALDGLRTDLAQLQSLGFALEADYFTAVPLPYPKALYADGHPSGQDFVVAQNEDHEKELVEAGYASRHPKAPEVEPEPEADAHTPDSEQKEFL